LDLQRERKKRWKEAFDFKQAKNICSLRIYLFFIKI
jgi:hypothetical protein